jgi:hypothetical protein
MQCKAGADSSGSAAAVVGHLHARSLPGSRFCATTLLPLTLLPPALLLQDVVRLEQQLHDLMGRMTEMRRHVKMFSLPEEYHTNPHFNPLLAQQLQPLLASAGGAAGAAAGAAAGRAGTPGVAVAAGAGTPAAAPTTGGTEGAGTPSSEPADMEQG